MKRRVGPVLLLLAGAGLVGIMLLYDMHTPLAWYREAYSGNTEVSGAFALFHVKKLSSPYFQGRAPGSVGGDRAARFIASQFQKLGLKPGGEGGTYFQTVTGKRFTLWKQGDRWKPKTSESDVLLADNVLGYLGADDCRNVTNMIIISAHYDHLGLLGKSFFPGANDNASGVAVLLEAARILKNKPLGAGTRIFFAAWTFEEEGIRGSTYFAANYPMKNVKAVINLDALGNGRSREYLVWTHQAKDPLLKLLTETAQELGIKLYPQVLPVSSNHTSDQQPFGKMGIPAVTITSPNWLEGNHTFQDTAEKVNEDKLKRAAELVVKAVERLVY